MKTKRAIDYFVYLLVRMLICIVQALPIDVCARGAGLLATVFCNWLEVRRDVVDDNLRHAFPDMSPAERQRLTWRMWEHLFLLAIEVAHAPRKINEGNWNEYLYVAGKRELVASLLDERPVVLVAAHYGNFELGAYVLAVLGFPSYTIARPLDNVYLDRFLNRFRGIKGQRILPKNGSAEQIAAVLASGGTLALLGDQHAGPKGCWVDFFGRPASTHKAIALFSLANDAPLFFSFCRRVGKPLVHLINASAKVDPRTATGELTTIRGLTQWYTHQLERTIREAPEQYWWVHRRWKDTRRKRANRAA